MPQTSADLVVGGLRLIRLVGRGGEGEVWEARTRAGRRRALKLIRPEALADPDEVVQRSEQLRRIDHPALVTVHRGGIVDRGVRIGWGFVEMELVEGRSLESAPPDPDLERLWPLAEALDLLHTGAWSDGLGLVHRDVKPANLIATPAGEVVLVDPSALRRVGGPMTLIGTPVYCAPEVFHGRAGPSSDTYSFAVTIVALATGARAERLAALLDDPARLDVPEGVRLALSPRPGERPASCRAVLEDAATIRITTDTIVLPPATTQLDPDIAAEDDLSERGVVDDGEWEVGRVWPWLVVLGLLLAAPIVAWAWAPAHLRTTAAAAVVGHLAATTLAGVPVGRSLLAPPLAWARLVADRSARPGWTEATAGGALLAGTGGMIVAASGLGPAGLGAAAALALLLVGVAVGAADRRGASAWLVRAALSPLWLVGQAVLALLRGLAQPTRSSA